MSLLDTGNIEVDVYPEEVVRDMDGNIRTRPAKTPFKLMVRLQPLGQSGTAARRMEQSEEGFETEQVLRMRVPRAYNHQFIGSEAKVVFDGQTWQVFGNPIRYRGSPRTEHVDYTLRRA